MANDIFKPTDSVNFLGPVGYLLNDSSNWSAGIPSNDDAVSLGYHVLLYDNLAALSLASLNNTAGATIFAINSTFTIDVLTGGGELAADASVVGGAPVTVTVGSLTTGGEVLGAIGAGAVLIDQSPVDPGNDLYFSEDGGKTILTAAPAATSTLFMPSGTTIALENLPPGTYATEINDLQPGDVLELPGTGNANDGFSYDTLTGKGDLEIINSAGTYDFALENYFGSANGFPITYTDPATGLQATAFSGTDTFIAGTRAASGPLSGDYLWSNPNNWSLNAAPTNNDTVTIAANLVTVDDLASVNLETLNAVGANIYVAGGQLTIQYILNEPTYLEAGVAGATAPATVTVGIDTAGGEYFAFGAGNTFIDTAAGDEGGAQYGAADGGAFIFRGTQLAATSALEYDTNYGGGTIALANLPAGTYAIPLEEVAQGDVLEVPGSTVIGIHFGAGSMTLTTSAGAYDFSNVTYYGTVAGYTVALDPTTGLQAITFQSSPLTGRAGDGYIDGAIVSDPDQSTTTAGNGQFTLVDSTGPLTLTGGVDISTGLPFTGTLEAPAGSTFLSPLTALVENVSSSQPNAEVLAGLNLPNVNLTTFDDIAGTQLGVAGASQVLQASSQLQNIETLIQAAGGSVNDAIGYTAAYIDHGNTLDLNLASDIALIASFGDLDDATAEAVASIASATATKLDAQINNADTIQVTPGGGTIYGTGAFNTATANTAATQLSSATSPAAVFNDITGAAIAVQGNATTIFAAINAKTESTAAKDTDYTNAASAFVQDSNLDQTLATDDEKATNLLTNGDFSAGATGFNVVGPNYQFVGPNSGAVYATGTNQGSAVGYVEIITDPQTDFAQGQGNENVYDSYGDHTTGAGQMLFVDGNGAGGATAFWSETVALLANVTYEFSYYVNSADTNNTSPPLIQFTINGTAIGNNVYVGAPSLNATGYGNWQLMTESFTTTSALPSATLSLVDTNTSAANNDFTIDDVSLAVPPQSPPVSGNLIINGDFSAGATGFEVIGPYYQLLTVGPGEYTTAQQQGSTAGDVEVVTNPQLAFAQNLGRANSYDSYGDHTTGSGQMLFVDGNGNAGGDAFWAETGISLAANTEYTFTYFVNVVDTNNSSPPFIAVILDGTEVGNAVSVTAPSLNPAGAANWQEETATFTTTSAISSATVALVDGNPGAANNDFTIDDISLVADPAPSAPTAPTINAPIAVTNSATPTLTGTGTPGSIINISDVTYELAFGGSAYKQVTTNLGTARVGGDGTWSFTVGTSSGSNGNALVTENLDATSYNFVASETNAAGIISNTVTSTTLVLDQTAPLIDITTPSNPVLLPPTIDGFIYVSPTNPSNDSDSSLVLTVTDVDTLNGVVTTTAATATAVDGNFSVPFTATPGTHVITAQATDAAGNVGTSAPITITPGVPDSTIAQINTAILEANSASSGTYTLDLASSVIALGNTALEVINLQPGVTLDIEGNGGTLDGGGTQRGLFVYSGAVTINNLAIDNAVAEGGAGGMGLGGGGGGAGLGGGLYVADDVSGGAATTGRVTLNNVSFGHDQAIGGMGAAAEGVYVPNQGAGGGGGLFAAGGAGGDPNISLGIFLGATGLGAAGLTDGYGGGAGDTASGAFTKGGFGGGTAGHAHSYYGTGGSGGGFGTSGGWGGGAGGLPDPLPGFPFYQSSGAGGGLAAGGDVFVQQGASLLITGSGTIATGTVIGGAGGTGNADGNAGQAFANGIYLQGSNTLTFNTAGLQTVAGVIGDDVGSAAATSYAGTKGYTEGRVGILKSGAGTLVLSAVNTYTGNTTIAGGTLDLATWGAAGSGTIVFGGPSDTLEIDGVPTTGVTPHIIPHIIAQDAAPQTVVDFTNPLSNFTNQDTLDLTGLPFVQGATAIVANGTLTIVDGSITEEFALINSTVTNFALAEDSSGGTEVACYCRGTRILTERGEVAVEDLAIGDRLITRRGEARALRWIGRRSYAGVFAQANPSVLPILIRAGAIAENVPKRDLYVSPLHAMFIDRILVPAQCLVNGASIVKSQGVAEVEYFHLELYTHDVIFAEEAESETYLDDDNRTMFQNAFEFGALYPDDVGASLSYCAPRLEDGDQVIAIHARLADRAIALGYRLAPTQTMALPGSGTTRMSLLPGTSLVRLQSTTGYAEGDRRKLGALLLAVRLDGQALDFADPAFASGFHPPERHGQAAVRWTSGEAVLTLAPAACERVLEVEVAVVMALSRAA